ncbi:MAG: class I SAM-dependent methyltransferase [archaeon]
MNKHSEENYSKKEYEQLQKERFGKQGYYSFISDFAEFKEHKDEKVLEIGVGAGTDILEYGKNGSICYGCDITENAVSLTKKIFKKYKLKGTFQVQDAEKMNYENNSFDLIYSFGVLHHTINSQKAINEVYRTLKPGGKFIIMLYARGWRHFEILVRQGILKAELFRFGYQKTINKNTESKDCPCTFVFSKKKIKYLFRKFENVKMNRVRYTTLFKNPKGWRKIMLSLPLLMGLFGLKKYLKDQWMITGYKPK